MPDGTLTESQLQAILLDDISTYLNVSRDFITVIILVDRDTRSGSATNLTNRTAPANTTTGRRLLYALPVEYNFTALFQLPSGNQTAYAQIKQFVKDTKLAATTIRDSNRYRLVLRRAELVPGYFDATGAALQPCPDGQDRIADNVTETLVCPPSRPTPAPTPAPKADWGGFVGLALALLAGLLGLLELMRRGRIYSNAKGRIQPNATSAAPPTVTIEYHLVPMHLI